MLTDWLLRDEYLKDRRDAGVRLAERMQKYKQDSEAIVLALPRGGVPVAYEIARSLNLPLDVIVVRKLGVPGQEELAMGAIAGKDVRVFNEEVIVERKIPALAIEKEMNRERQELVRRNKHYRHDKPQPNLRHKNVILVDDGIATGATVKAAILAIKQQKPAEIILAVPVAAATSLKDLTRLVKEIVCLQTPYPFHNVAEGYASFPQVSDQEVIQLLAGRA